MNVSFTLGVTLDYTNCQKVSRFKPWHYFFLGGGGGGGYMMQLLIIHYSAIHIMYHDRLSTTHHIHTDSVETVNVSLFLTETLHSHTLTSCWIIQWMELLNS